MRAWPYCVWLLSLSAASPGLTHAVAGARTSSLSKAGRHPIACMDRIRFTHSLVTRSLLAVVSHAATNVDVQIPL